MGYVSESPADSAQGDKGPDGKCLCVPRVVAAAREVKDKIVDTFQRSGRQIGVES